MVCYRHANSFLYGLIIVSKIISFLSWISFNYFFSVKEQIEKGVDFQ